MDLGNHTEGTEGQVTFLRLCCWEKWDNFKPLHRPSFQSLSMRLELNRIYHYAQNWLRFQQTYGIKLHFVKLDLQ